jgi:GTP-binding protein Era
MARESYAGPPMRFGTVAVVGRSNVGKSTFLNQAIGERLAIVSPRLQTTRDALLGICHLPQAQVAFVDTPGLHRPKNELGRRMNLMAWEAVRRADALVIMTAVGRLSRASDPTLDPEDRDLVAQVESRQPALVVINKVDTLRDKSRLLPLLGAWAAAFPGRELIPGSMLDRADVDRVLGELVPLLPEGVAQYPADDLTDRPTSFFVREYVREQVLLAARGEVPHAVAVSLDEVAERGNLLVAKATIHVEKVGQRKILIGRGGRSIRELGRSARERLECLLDRKVYLELFVRVSPCWRDAPTMLGELGYAVTRAAHAAGPARKP